MILKVTPTPDLQMQLPAGDCPTDFFALGLAAPTQG